VIKMRVVVAVVLTHYCIVLYSAGQTNGSVHGAVMDEKGEPVSAARVTVDPLGGAPRSDIVREAETDKNGHFSIADLELGAYKVFAMKEAAGYPNTAFAFYSNHIFPTVTLTATAPVVDMVLKIGPPAGVIKGAVRDANTGKPVNAGFLLRRAADRENWVSLSQQAGYRVLVPPSTDIIFEVSAPGYKTWYYGGDADSLKRSPLHLESSQEIKVDVQLERDPALSGSAQQIAPTHRN
jgi:hypothetical protein